MLEGKTIAVNPKNTSQDCSNCGEKVPKELNIRTHSCPHCCIVIDYDLFAICAASRREAFRKKCGDKYQK
ncbi:zinc ribbon domain-containing protein [Okeania sp. SIO2B3]|uniref:zinc ribbon domain-containing protein n=1 Tax=Okeania sp. SIO2B3 TaxID=2607784 RepID=UPI00343DD116